MLGGSGRRLALVGDHLDLGHFEVLVNAYSFFGFFRLGFGLLVFADLFALGPSSDQSDLMAHMVFQRVVAADLQPLLVVAVGQRVRPFLIRTSKAAGYLMLSFGLAAILGRGLIARGLRQRHACK